MRDQSVQRDNQNVNGPAKEGGKQSSGGATGYDVQREQQQISQEREEMHNERPKEDLNVEESQPSPEKNDSKG